jgi:hypothetical protein
MAAIVDELREERAARLAATAAMSQHVDEPVE